MRSKFLKNQLVMGSFKPGMVDKEAEIRSFCFSCNVTSQAGSLCLNLDLLIHSDWKRKALTEARSRRDKKKAQSSKTILGAHQDFCKLHFDILGYFQIPSKLKIRSRTCPHLENLLYLTTSTSVNLETPALKAIWMNLIEFWPFWAPNAKACNASSSFSRILFNFNFGLEITGKKYFS